MKRKIEKYTINHGWILKNLDKRGYVKMKATELKELTNMIEDIKKKGVDFIDDPQYRIGFRFACRLIDKALKEHYLKKGIDFSELCDIISTESEV